MVDVFTWFFIIETIATLFKYKIGELALKFIEIMYLFTILVIFPILVILNKRQDNNEEKYDLPPECRLCHRPIHKIPKIEEKKLLISGIEVSVDKYPICCNCYNEYVKWKKIFGLEEVANNE